VDTKTVNAEKKRLEGELKRLWSFYLEESYAVYMLRRKLLEKQGEFFAEALSDAENVTEDSFSSEGLHFPKEFYVKLVKIEPHLISLFPKIVSEGALIRLVSVFEYFITNSISSILETYPDLVYDRFRGSDNPVQEHLKYLRENSLQKKLGFIAQRLKISLDVENFKGKELKEIVATRHVITHNRGMVDDKYRKDVSPHTTFRSGEERPVDDEYFEGSVRVLNSAVAYLYWEMTEKYCGTVW
jgi:hypothetical protein